MRLARTTPVQLWLPLLPAAVALLLLGLVVVATDRIVGDELRRRAGFRVEQAASLYADQTSRVLGRRAAELELIGLFGRYDVDLPAWRAEMQRLKATSDAYVWIGVTDNRGVVVAGTDGLLEGVSIETRPVFRQGRRGLWFGSLHAPKALIEPLQKQGLPVPVEMADIAQPVLDATGAVRGVIATHLDASYFETLRAGVLGPPEGRRQLALALVDGEGQVLLGDVAPVSDAAWKALLNAPADDPRQVAGTDDGTLLVSRSMVTPTDAVLRTDWQVVAWQPLDAALLPVAELERGVLLWGGLAALMFGIGGFLVSRRLARPYIDMLDAVAGQMGTDVRETPGTYLRVIAEQMRRLPTPGATGGEQALAQVLHDAGRLQAVLDSLPAPVYLVDGDDTVLYWNAASEQVFGWPSAEAVGRPLSALLQGESVQRELQAMRVNAAVGRGPWTFEAHLRRRDGTDIWGEWRVTRVHGMDGSPIGLLTQVRDLTAEREAAQRLREQGEVLGAVINSASDAVISVDIDGRISLFNPAAARIFGHPADGMLGQPLDMLLPADQRIGHVVTMQRFAESSVTTRPMGVGRVRGLRADGAVLELEASISQITVRGRKLLTAILRDVTDRVRAEQALAQYQTELSELTQQLLHQEQITTRELAQTLHDQLGQTLGAIRLSFDSLGNLLRDQVDERAARRAMALSLQIDQAIREVRQALVVLRPPLLEEAGLVAALDNEVRQRAPVAEPVLLALAVDAPVQTQRWPADVEYAAFMIAREAIDNALRHARATVVEVRVQGDADTLLVVVHDDGTGLDDDLAAGRPGHLGMVGMRERALAIGARLVARASPEGGTDITLSWNARPLSEGAAH